MPMSRYMRALREKIGNDLIVMPSVTVLTFDADGRVLLVRHAEGNVWGAPGGQIEPGEAAGLAAVREIREETGLEVELVRLLGVYGGPEFEVAYPNGDRISYVMTVFEGEVRGGSARPDGSEILELRYVSRAELRELTVGRWLPVVLEAAIELRAHPDRGARWN
jgi:ADP-ribose pyrophosphatase YjhB (NUDIX family)